MRRTLLNFLSLFLFLGLAATTTFVNAQTRPYRVTDRQVQALITRITTNTNVYKNQLDTALNRARLSNGDSADAIYNSITDFENAADSLKQKVGSRGSANSDVEDVLTRAADINAFMQRNRLNAMVQRTWTRIRTDLNTLANYYSVSWNWNNANQNSAGNNNQYPTTTGGVRPYRISDSNVQTLLGKIQTRTDEYKREVGFSLERGAMNKTRSQESINNYISDFEKATDNLRRNFDARRSTTADVEEVLNRAYYVDGFMRDYSLTPAAETQWRAIRADLDTLANYYSVSWNWNRQYQPASRFDSNITGTYRLNTGQSDNVQEIVDRAAANLNANQRDRITKNLERRLTPPDMLAIQKRGNEVTIASSTAPQVTFQADGVGRTETNPNGRAIKTTATTNYDGISLSYEGDRVNDFYVNFNQSSNGQLRVVRRLYLENQNQTVTVASVYDKTSETADLTITNNQTVGGNNGGGNINDFIIPNNTRLTAVLRTPVSTKASQSGDRFQMEVTSPSEYNGAIIEGRVAKAERSGRVSGRANVSLEFDTIRLRNGQTYRFGGIVEDVTSANGEKVTVNNEGAVRDNNQTTKTVQRAGIGAALGAIIGAIAGGGEGAVIGAGVGAGAGAGTVILQGRDDVELGEGTQFSITATAPNNVGNNR
ncbi:MAG: hypothetical protein ACR2HG_09640 [Pyrinomonadaceae bacterium]